MRLHVQGALTVHGAALDLAAQGWDVVQLDLRDKATETYTITVRPHLVERRHRPLVIDLTQPAQSA
jgi:hypothetical protein